MRDHPLLLLGLTPMVLVMLWLPLMLVPSPRAQQWGTLILLVLVPVSFLLWVVLGIRHLARTSRTADPGRPVDLP